MGVVVFSYGKHWHDIQYIMNIWINLQIYVSTFKYPEHSQGPFVNADHVFNSYWYDKGLRNFNSRTLKLD